MSGTQTARSMTVNTVLGPVPADELGVVLVHEALLSVVPGAEYAYDITIDRAEVFETLVAKLAEFRDAGGRTIVDASGMFHGRDPKLYEALSRTTGVHIVASTGQGPEDMLGGYFLTPQTNPPTPWPAEKWSELFGNEVTEGMVVPRVERRGPAGIIATTATREAMTATDASLFAGAARAAAATGVPVSIRFGADVIADLEVVLAEGLDASRVAVASIDRRDAINSADAIAERGAYVVLDHVGSHTDGFITDDERIAAIIALIASGHLNRILISASATGVSFGEPGNVRPFSNLLTTFVPALKAAGVSDADVQRILVDNPRDLLTVKEN